MAKKTSTRYPPEIRERAVPMALEHQDDHGRNGRRLARSRRRSAARRRRYAAGFGRLSGQWPSLVRRARSGTGSRRWSGRSGSCGRRTRFSARPPNILRWRSSTADPSHEVVHRRASRRLRGRADLPVLPIAPLSTASMPPVHAIPPAHRRASGAISPWRKRFVGSGTRISRFTASARSGGSSHAKDSMWRATPSHGSVPLSARGTMGRSRRLPGADERICRPSTAPAAPGLAQRATRRLCVGGTICLSCLLEVGRYEELPDLLTNAPTVSGLISASAPKPGAPRAIRWGARLCRDCRRASVQTYDHRRIDTSVRACCSTQPRGGLSQVRPARRRGRDLRCDLPRQPSPISAALAAPDAARSDRGAVAPGKGFAAAKAPASSTSPSTARRLLTPSRPRWCGRRGSVRRQERGIICAGGALALSSPLHGAGYDPDPANVRAAYDHLMTGAVRIGIEDLGTGPSGDTGFRPLRTRRRANAEGTRPIVGARRPSISCGTGNDAAIG